jgi:hypothetical protein
LNRTVVNLPWDRAPCERHNRCRSAAMSAWLRTGVRQMARFGELRRCPPTAGLDWITGIGDTTSTELYRTRLNPIRKGRLRRMRYQACSPAVNAEVAKRGIFATRNPLKSRGRPRLISPISKLRAASLKLWPDHRSIMREFRRPTSDQTSQPNPPARCITSA